MAEDYHFEVFDAFDEDQQKEVRFDPREYKHWDERFTPADNPAFHGALKVYRLHKHPTGVWILGTQDCFYVDGYCLYPPETSLRRIEPADWLFGEKYELPAEFRHFVKDREFKIDAEDNVGATTSKDRADEALSTRPGTGVMRQATTRLTSRARLLSYADSVNSASLRSHRRLNG